MGLARHQLQHNRQAARIGHSMDPGGQAAARAPHADGSTVGPTGGFGAPPFCVGSVLVNPGRRAVGGLFGTLSNR